LGLTVVGEEVDFDSDVYGEAGSLVEIEDHDVESVCHLFCYFVLLYYIFPGRL